MSGNVPGIPPEDPLHGALVIGLCPVCEAWQVDVLRPVQVELGVIGVAVAIEEAMGEHDDADHPGELRAWADREHARRAERIRALQDAGLLP